MTIFNFVIIFYTTILVFSSLYAPQPLQPVLKVFFNVTESTAALSTTLTLVPLSIAPIFYGIILEKVTSKKILKISILFLSLSEFLLYIAPNFQFFLFVRFFQGLLIPAILTSLMTYISVVVENNQIQRFMSFYIASTIAGGFLGRAISGFISIHYGWRNSFLMLFISLFICFILLNFLNNDSRIKVEKIKPSMLLEIIKEKTYFKIYFVIFCSFFVFAALLNFLPFHLKEISIQMGEFKIGLMYSGYLMGIIVTLNSIKFVKFFKSEIKTITYALVIYIISVFLFSIPIISSIFIVMFLFCAGMFLIHSVASSYLNKISKNKKGIINGFYIASYYAGGSLGSILPGIIYKDFGWFYFLLFLNIILLIAVLSLNFISHQEIKKI